MQLVSLYSFDPTGRATANRIENQSITVSPPSSITDYSYVVPRGAPFYAESLVVKDGRSAGARTLVENVDYWCVIDFLSASTALTKRVSVGIALLDPGYSGTLYITYQAVGGNYSLADYSVLEELIRERYVVKHVSYEQVINLPEGFAPEWHAHEVADMVGMGQVVTMLDNIKVAINGRQGSYGQLNTQISNHVGSSAAHTPSQVGLSNVKNYDVATLAEATSGAGNKYVVASIMKQYVNSQMQDLSGFITTVTADATFATKAMLNSYSTTAVADGKYALKSDVYTKAQVNALIEGIDVSSSLGGFYTKAQSDGKYLLKTDISEYIKETVADGRYATKSSMSAYSTTAVTDGKYALKTASYTKSESDGRYLGTTALNGYLTQSVADGKYQTKSDMTAYLPVNSQSYGRVSTVGFSNTATGKRLTITDTNPAGPKTWTADLDLSEYTKSNGAVSRDDVINAYLYTMQRMFQWHDLRISTVVTGYFSNKLTTNWVVIACRFTRSIKIHAYVVTPFYYNEDTDFPLTLSGGRALPNVGTNVVDFEYMNASADLRGYHYQQDTWVRPTTAYARLDRAAGTLSLPLRFSVAAENKSSYSSGLLATFELACLNDTDFKSILDLMHLVGNVTTSDMATPHSYLNNLPTPLPYDEGLKAHLKW